MGRFRQRLKSSKGKRWLKGQSSSSNPQIKKFRDAARKGMFLPIGAEARGQSLLTSAALKVFDGGSVGSLSTLSMDEDATTNTCDSYASMYSACSNQSFNRLFRSFRPDSALHKDMLAVLAAVTEVIKSRGGKESDTEYFAALVTAMEAMEGEEILTAAASLLVMGMKRLHPSVLIAKFPECSKLFMNLLEHWAPRASPFLLKALIGCLSHLLRAQDLSRWKEPSTVHCYNAILSCTLHPKPRLRRAAQNAVCAILRGSGFMLDARAPSHHPVAANTAEHLIKQLESVGLDAVTSTLHIFGLLKETLPLFPSDQVKRVCESILKVIKLGNVLTLTCGLKALHGLVLVSPATSTLPPKLNAQLIVALGDFRPALHDSQPLNAWLTTTEEAHVNLCRIDPELGVTHVLNLMKTCTQLWRSDREEVHAAAAKTFQKMLNTCSEDNLQTAFAYLEESLKYQYHPAWPHVLTTIGVFFQIAKQNAMPYSGSCLKTLAELRSTPDFCYIKELDTALGHAVASLGPRVFLRAIPLQITGNQLDDLSFPRSWLLPVLRDHVHSSELEFFNNYFIPLAENCKKRALHEDVDSAVGRAYTVIFRQIWSLLPAFCTDPVDIKTSFGGMAKILGKNLSENSDISKDIMAAIRLLVKSSLKSQEDKATLSRFSKNFLPLFFTIYTNEEQSPAVLETIHSYLEVTDEKFIEQLLNTALGKYAEAVKENQHSIQELMLDLIRTLIGYIRRDCVEDAYREVLPLLSSKNKRLQKRAYRVLEAICSSQTEACTDFVRTKLEDIKNTLFTSLSTTNSAAKAARLCCLISLCEKLNSPQKDFIKAVVSEAIFCIRDNNHKARSAALKLLTVCIKLLQVWSDISLEETVKEFIELLINDASSSPEASSATLLALSHILHNFEAIFPVTALRPLVEQTATALTSDSRELVQSAIKFINTFILSCPAAVVRSHLPIVMNGLCSMREESKNHFRNETRDLLCRLIRKFGYTFLKSFVPIDDVILLKRLKNLRKTEARKLRARKTNSSQTPTEKSFVESSRMQSIEDLLADTDSEVEDSTMETSQQNSKKLNSWIQEAPGEIVDLLGTNVSQKLSSKQPTSKKVKSGAGPVVIGDDGKIIVKNNSNQADEDDESEVELMDVMGGDETLEKDDPIPVQDDDDNDKAPKYKAGGKGIHRPIKKRGFGEEYKAKKAGGDIKKKGKPDPYAYVRLNPAQLNKRKRAKLSGQFKGLVRGAKKGALKGTKLKRKKKKGSL